MLIIWWNFKCLVIDVSRDDAQNVFECINFMAVLCVIVQIVIALIDYLC